MSNKRLPCKSGESLFSAFTPQSEFSKKYENTKFWNAYTNINFETGKKVYITGGAYGGISGVTDEIAENGKIKVLVSIGANEGVIEVDECDIKKQDSNSFEFNNYKAEDFIPKFNKLQPDNFDEFIGQNEIKEIIKLEIEGCKRKQEPLRHILFYGRPGLGKTTLAKIIARAVGKPFFEVTASGFDNVQKIIDLVDKINTIGQKGSILFIDEIHMLPKDIQTHIFSLMTDNRLTLVKKNVVQTIDVTPITIIGATNYMGSLVEAFRSRFALAIKFVPYSSPDMQTIIQNNANRLGIKVESDVLKLLAMNCQKSPRVAENLTVTATRITGDTLTLYDVKTMFELLKIYPDGLQVPQVNILYALAKAEDGSLGINTLSKIIGEDVVSINEEWENYLMEENYITISKGRGREITEKGKKYLSELNKLKKENK